MLSDADRKGRLLKADTVLENFLEEVGLDLRRNWMDGEMKVGNFKEKINLASLMSNIPVTNVAIVFCCCCFCFFKAFYFPIEQFLIA